MTKISTPAIWTKFLDRYYPVDILIFVGEYPDRRSLHIDFINVEKFNPNLSGELLERPTETLADADRALADFALPTNKRLDGAHIRITGVPNLVSIRQIRGIHTGKLIAINGLCRVATDVKPRVQIAAFECLGCGEVMYTPQAGDKLIDPQICRNDGCGRRKSFKFLADQSEMVDAQKLRIQESPEGLRRGQPRMLDIVLEDDLVDLVSPGDQVTVVGILHSYLRVTPRGDRSNTLDTILNANSVEIHDKELSEVEISEEEEQQIIELGKDPNIYSRIIRSIAPSIYGLENVKEGLALQLMSGVPKDLPDGTRIRGDVHILLVGDPGIAKSQLLRYMVGLSPRGVYASGRSSSGPGLTATVTKSTTLGDDSWILEAGALVLADHGFAAVDEMDKMRPEDRSAIHECMEQQRVSVAKAGIMATLMSRCPILGAANPKYGKFDPYEGVAQQIKMAPTLLSRFDLIYTIKDEADADKDAALATHILNAHHAGELRAHHKAYPSGTHSTAAVEAALDTMQPEIPSELFRKYIVYAKKNIFPVMNKEIKEQVVTFYVKLRQQGEARDAAVVIAPRQLEGIVRLSEASARIRLDNEVTLGDAARAFRVTESCINQVANDPETGKIDIGIITTGHSKSQWERIRVLKGIISKIAAEHGGTAPKREVAAEAVAHGFDTEDLESLIENLITIGDISTPTKDTLVVWGD